jgi:CubicO group peptidase (beta-lactamase class C family)
VITALVTGSALSERKIGWPEEPVGNFIPEWRDDPRGAITVRNLLQLSSGLEAPTPSRSPWSVAASEAYGSDIVPQYLHRPLAAPPGRNWVDQSADPDLLALVIEKATGQRYAQYVSQALWQRIGAADAWVSLDRPGGAARVDHGFLVRQGDWIRVAELLLTNGRYQGDEVIVPRWIPQMLEPARSNKDYGSYVRLGAHASAGMTPYVSTDVFLVEGGGNRLWLVPSLQIAILRTANPLKDAAGTTAASGMSDWDDARIPNLIIRGARDFVPSVARPGGDLSKLVPNH